MDVSVFAREPSILHEALVDDLFLVHTVELAECVCAHATRDARRVDDHCDVLVDPSDLLIVVIGCRVGRDSPLYLPTGDLRALHRDTPITLLDQVERVALRERGSADDSASTLDSLQQRIAQLRTAIAAHSSLGAQAPPKPEPISRL